ncbi:hypothetical protein BDF20DRAFT_832110 [Mycotypha africana]|uniref:uncharacterized protein n=1 Tax=Mycotypha africana TaxID=64632 RepID=UPI00230072A2|nr:uncharacterized protein BDF20DRAFT_832110 [Mycotypha africana]KAI8992129.1 hypothetical protein BDF20DRAFT_832110 [Mycotypha africana]
MVRTRTTLSTFYHYNDPYSFTSFQTEGALFFYQPIYEVKEFNTQRVIKLCKTLFLVLSCTSLLPTRAPLADSSTDNNNNSAASNDNKGEGTNGEVGEENPRKQRKVVIFIVLLAGVLALGGFFAISEGLSGRLKL